MMLNVTVQDENQAPVPVATDEKSQHGVALALGGGVARGWSHIGTIRALEEAEIPVSMIAGTSIGALVGGCYLAGKLDELEDFARGLTPRRILSLLDISLRGTGLISGYKLAEHMEKHLGDIRIEDLDRPLVCVATEITSGHEIWLTQGPLIDAMRASYALPGIFEPVHVGDRVLVDGALVNPVPVSVCRAYESRAVTAVNLSWDAFGRSAVVREASSDNSPLDIAGDLTKNTSGKRSGKNQTGSANAHRLGKTLGLTGVMVEAFNIIQDRISRSRLAGDPPDISIRPKVGDIGLAEFHRADETIQMGYEATMREISRLRSLAAVSQPAS